MATPSTSLRLPAETLDRLRALALPGESLSGVVERAALALEASPALAPTTDAADRLSASEARESRLEASPAPVIPDPAKPVSPLLQAARRDDTSAAVHDVLLMALELGLAAAQPDPLEETQARRPCYSLENYLATERESVDDKHEYVAGQVFAMAGATFNHNLITTNLARDLSTQLKSRPCTVLSSDMRVRIETADACAYPDVVVLCDPPAFHDRRRDVLTNATLVAEVLSPATEGYDRGGKFAIYRGLPSLRQYVLIAQDRPAVDVFTRQADGRWVLDAYADLEAPIHLEAIGCTLLLREVYDKVEFETPEQRT